MTLAGKKILLGITGAIAAYKICELIRKFKKASADVKVVLSPNALEFIGIKTLETLSGNEVYIEQFAPRNSTKHISLADWADLFLIAPASANSISKFANGIADNLLTSVFCATLGKKIPTILAPTMNDGMWANPFVQENLKKLQNNNCKIVEPEIGALACGSAGIGRLPDIEVIFEKCKEKLNENKPLAGKKIVITAGGTREYIDPVRFIGNSSSGKMGLALADCAYELGAEVELICTFEIQKNYKTTFVENAHQMQLEVEKAFEKCSVLIMAAAVSDYRVNKIQTSKIDKKKCEKLTLELVKNTDILKSVAAKKTEFQKVIGFCLSTENVIENAKLKLKNKNCDFIIANEAKTALGGDNSEIWIVDSALNVQKIEKNSKINLAKKILELL